MTIEHIFESLASVRWDVARRTFGNSHATLIGLMVQWWIDLASSHSAFEGAPSFGSAGAADALLCDGDEPVGVLEVEGTRPLEKVQTIGRYFSSERAELSRIGFGILLVYAYAPKGTGSGRSYLPSETVEIIEAALSVSRAFPAHHFILMALDKRYEKLPGLRSGEYAGGIVSRVGGVLLQGGIEQQRTTHFQ